MVSLRLSLRLARAQDDFYVRVDKSMHRAFMVHCHSDLWTGLFFVMKKPYNP